MKQIGAKINSKIFCLQRSLRTISPSLQLAKWDEGNHNTVDVVSHKSNDFEIPKIEEVNDYPSFDMSSFGLVDDTFSTSMFADELNDNFEYLLDKLLEEFKSVDVVDMPERLMKMRQWKTKPNIHLFYIVLPLIRRNQELYPPKMELFFTETQTESTKIAKRKRLRSRLQPQQAIEHKNEIKRYLRFTNGPKNSASSRMLHRPIHLDQIKPNYQSVPSRMGFEERLRDILEQLDSPENLKSYLNYPEPSLEHSNSFFFDEWESWYQKIMNLVTKIDSYTGGDPDFDLFADRSICVDFLWPKDPSYPIPNIPMNDTYRNTFLLPFFEIVGPVEHKLPPSITKSFHKIKSSSQADHPMIFTIPEISFQMGRAFQNASGKILVVYKNPEDAKKAIQIFNSKRFCDFPFFDFIKTTYENDVQRPNISSSVPKSLRTFLSSEEYFDKFELQVEKLSKNDFNSFMKYRDFEMVLANSRGQLGDIFGLPEDSPIFQAGPHWKKLSMNRDPYRTDIYRENQAVFYNRDKTFKRRDDFQRHRMISDIQLGIFANLLGIGLFLMIIAYHWVSQATEAKKMKQN